MIRKVGFIGLGMMGHGMAKNILEKGFALTVLGHRNRGPVEDLVGRGAIEAPSPRELAERTDAVFLCVTGAPEVEALVLGQGGVIEGCRPGSIVVDCTTSQPAVTLKIAAALAELGAFMVDAPVTRAPKDAEAGHLNSLVGASPEILETIRPVLETYSETITHFGPVGAGNAAKLVNNFITTGYTALIAEGMAMCAVAGVDMRKAYDVMSRGAADSGVMRKMIPPFLDGDLTGHRFFIRNALKDVSYFRDMAQAFGFSSLLSEALHRTYAEAVDAGLGERLMASLAELHERRNGIRVVPTRSWTPSASRPNGSRRR